MVFYNLFIFFYTTESLEIRRTLSGMTETKESDTLTDFKMMLPSVDNQQLERIYRVLPFKTAVNATCLHS